MAGIGLSKPKAAIYANTSGTTSYTSGKAIGKAVNLSLSLDQGGNDNILYADNGAAESDAGSFAGGTITLTVDDLSPESADFLLGITPVSETVTGVTGVSLSHFNSGNTIPYVGFGAIRKKQVSNVVKYQVIFFPKVQFTYADEDWTTQGETIEWQTAEITANLLREDTADGDWKVVSNYLDTEADAEKVLNHLLGISA